MKQKTIVFRYVHDADKNVTLEFSFLDDEKLVDNKLKFRELLLEAANDLLVP